MIINSSIGLPLLTGRSDSKERMSASIMDNRDRVASEPLQLLAMQIEQARIKLSRLLIQNQFALFTLQEQFLSKLRSGVESSDLVLGNSIDDYIVQPDLFVQPDSQGSTGCDIEIDAPAKGFINSIDSIDIEELSNFHFLPAFLIEVSNRVLEKMQVMNVSDRTFKNQLLRSQQQLQSFRQQMIVKNTGLVAFVARKHKTTNLSFDDLMQEGVIGLIKAVDRFDYTRSIRFSTYAIFWIKQAISRLIVKQEKIVRLPVALAEKASAVLEIIRISYQQNERWPTWLELQEQSNLSESEIKTIISYYQATHSLDASLHEDDDDLTLMDQMKQHQFALPLNALIDHGLSQYIEQIIASLPEKEATILTWRFGLKNNAEMTLQAVADHLHVTRERVRQIQNEALKKLKQQFGYELKLFLEANDS